MQSTALRYFISVARTGSFTKAAAQTHVAVSAISRQMTLLEQELETKLFTRLPRGVELTPEGEVFFAYAQRAALDACFVRQEMKSLRKTASFEIRLGASEGLAQNILPVAMASFSQIYPEVLFTLQTVSPPKIAKKIKEGSIDIGLNYTIEKTLGVSIKKTWRAPVYVFMAKNHPLSEHTTLDLDSLLSYPLALTEEDSTAHSLLKRSHALSGQTRPLRIALRSNFSQALIKYVAKTQALGLSGFLSLSWRLDQDELLLKPLTIPDFEYRMLHLQCMQGRTLPEPMQRFIEVLVHVIDQELLLG